MTQTQNRPFLENQEFIDPGPRNFSLVEPQTRSACPGKSDIEFLKLNLEMTETKKSAVFEISENG